MSAGLAFGWSQMQNQLTGGGMEMPSQMDESKTETTDEQETATESSSPTERKYSSEEVAEIIRLSLQDESGNKDDAVDYEELISIAREVGVDSERVDRAVELLEDEQSARDKERYLWARFRTHCILFIGVNLFCVTLNVFGSSDTAWSLYVIFGWGLFLLGHYAGLRYAPGFVEIAMERTEHVANAKYRQFFEDDNIVGFTVPDPMGLSESQGVVNLEDDRIIIEYQTLDTMLGFLKTKVKVAEVSIKDLTNARIEQGLWTTDLVLSGKNLRCFGNTPGSAGGKLRLKINRQSRRAAERLVSQLREQLNH